MQKCTQFDIPEHQPVPSQGSEQKSAPLLEWRKLADVARRNHHLFRSYSSLYYFVEQHETELLAKRIVARQGTSKRAPILVCEALLLDYFISCATRSSE